MDMNQSDRTFGATKTFRNQVTVDLGGGALSWEAGSGQDQAPRLNKSSRKREARDSSKGRELREI